MNFRGKKILFIAPTNELIAGGEISHFELIKSAKKRGYKVYVVLPAKGTFNNALKKLHIKTEITSYSFWQPNIGKETNTKNLQAIGVIADFINKEGIDCVITNTLNIPWGAVAAALTNTPHTWIAREFPENEFAYLEDKYNFISSFSNVLIANSQNLAKYMQKQLRLPQTKYFYSYVNSKEINLSRTVSTTRIVHIGSVLPRKNQLDTLIALKLLRDKHHLSPKLIFIGSLDKDSPYYKELKSFITKNNLNEQITFLGYKQSPFSFVSKNDIVVQPSKSESIGRVVTECMKLGLITIGSDIDGNKEAFTLGGGLLYKVGNTSQLSDIISDVLTSPEKYRMKTKLTQKNALSNMSEEACSNPFFIELNKVFGASNPMNMLAHLLPVIDVSNLLDIHNIETRQLKKTIRNYENQLNTIARSRSRKTIISLNKILGRDGHN